jgi:hypothetical protein
MIAPVGPAPGSVPRTGALMGGADEDAIDQAFTDWQPDGTETAATPDVLIW